MNVPTTKLIKSLVLVAGLLAVPLSYAGIDSDGIPDESDNCPTVANPDQADFDGDGRGDVCDADDDADGVIDQLDPFPFNPNYSADTDGDGLPDSYETSVGLDPEVDDALDDEDIDGLTNLEEFEAGTNPNLSDTDMDTLPDGYEVEAGRSPLVKDFKLVRISGFRDCLYDRQQNVLCGEKFPYQFESPVKNIELVNGGYCGVSELKLECTFPLADANEGAISLNAETLETLEIQDFEVGGSNKICVLLNDPRKTVCFQGVFSKPVMDRDRDGVNDLDDPCPETSDNACLEEGKPPGWKRAGHGRIVGSDFGIHLYSETYGRPGNPGDLNDFLLTYNENDTVLTGDTASGEFCASDNLFEQFEIGRGGTLDLQKKGGFTCTGGVDSPLMQIFQDDDAEPITQISLLSVGAYTEALCALSTTGDMKCLGQPLNQVAKSQISQLSDRAVFSEQGIEHLLLGDLGGWKYYGQSAYDRASDFANGVVMAAGSCVWFKNGSSECFEANYSKNDRVMRRVVGLSEPAVNAVGWGSNICAELEGGRIRCVVNGRRQSNNLDALELNYVLADGETLVGMMPGLARNSYGNIPGLIIRSEEGQRVVAPNQNNAYYPDWIDNIIDDVIATTPFGCFLLATEVICEDSAKSLPPLVNPTLVASPDETNHSTICVLEQRGVLCTDRTLPLITDPIGELFFSSSENVCLVFESGGLRCFDSSGSQVLNAPNIVKGIRLDGFSGLYLNSVGVGTICGIDSNDQLLCAPPSTNATPVEWAIGQYAYDPDGDGVDTYKPDLYPLNSAESGDYDGDGIGDNEDTDDDSDGIPDDEDPYPLDTDNDGLNNDVDEDDDSDGLNDDVDPAPLDTDNDGLNNGVDSDDDGDGVDDVDDQLPLDPTGYLDNDGDGISDPVDPDDDNDGLDDEFDEFPFDPNEQVDSDGDGLGNNADAFPFDETETSDTDGDGVGDNSDAFPEDPDETIDTDGDGVGDNGDAFPNDASETVDSDGDGVGDNADAFPNDASETRDTDGDGLGNNADLDDDGDGLADTDEAQLGTDPLNADTDRDGVNDGQDAFPTNPSETTDSDGDGVGNNGDAFPFDSSETQDSDSDGVGDNADAFPNDASETLDTDSDGVGNNADPDDDGDGLSDIDEVNLGTDPLLSDTDSDGTDDGQDAFPNDASEDADSDSDGVGDNADVFPDDPSETQDSDGDGVGDNSDAFPGNPNETLDTDSDGIGNNADSDDDGDGVNDAQDAFPLDPSETADTDADGVGNNADADDDNDGILDGDDAFPLDASETIDTDGDGTGNNADTDDDGDGLSDNQEIEIGTDPLLRDSDQDGVDDGDDAFPTDNSETTDSDGDGVGDNADAFPNDSTETTDTDGDGVGDNGDAFPNDVSETSDNDSDGLGDNADNDDDNDGYADNVDAFPLDADENTDTDGDGLGNNEDTDDDGDGFSDADELSAGTDPLNESSYPVVEEAPSGMPIWLYYITTQLDSAAKQEN